MGQTKRCGPTARRLYRGTKFRLPLLRVAVRVVWTCCFALGVIIGQLSLVPLHLRRPLRTPRIGILRLLPLLVTLTSHDEEGYVRAYQERANVPGCVVFEEDGYRVVFNCEAKIQIEAKLLI